MFERGKIVLVPFPFTDLSSQKIRPALILSRTQKQAETVIVAFISSKIQNTSPHCVSVSQKDAPSVGLKVASWIRCDKIATLDKRIVLGEIGVLPKLYFMRVEKMLKSVLGL